MKKYALIAIVAFLIFSCSNNSVRCGEYDAYVTEYSEYTYFDERSNTEVTDTSIVKHKKPSTILISKDDSNVHDFQVSIKRALEGTVVTYADLTSSGLDILPYYYDNDYLDVCEYRDYKFVKSDKDTLWIEELFLHIGKNDRFSTHRKYIAVKKQGD